MLFRKKRTETKFPYDPDRHIAVIRCSICTGEQTAGFREKETGVFHEERLIRGEDDLSAFKASYGLQSVKKEY